MQPARRLVQVLGQLDDRFDFDFLDGFRQLGNVIEVERRRSRDRRRRTELRPAARAGRRPSRRFP
jgi:hypothetical protein